MEERMEERTEERKEETCSSDLMEGMESIDVQKITQEKGKDGKSDAG